MTRYTPSQIKNREFNMNQTRCGSALRTLKGSKISRHLSCGGKYIGGKIYFEKSYANRILPLALLDKFRTESKCCPFEFKLVRYDLKSNQFAFIECPDFDVAREPVVGKVFIMSKPVKSYHQIYHHKWLFVDNSYRGFDVNESWEWSKTWLCKLTQPADGTNAAKWLKQLKKFHLI